jgi:competence protein ComEC
MFHWTPFALVRIALFFIAGILLGVYQPQLFMQWHSVMVAITFTIFYFGGYFFWRGRALSTTSGVLGLAAVFFFGYAHVLLQTDRLQADTFVNNTQPVKSYTVKVRSVPEEKANSWKIEAQITSYQSEAWMPTRGKVLLYISKEMGEPTWNYSEEILIKGSPQLLQPPANPGEFDFKRFLSFKNIYHQQFVRKNEVAFVLPTQQKGFIYYSHQARKWAAEKINQFIAGKQEQAIAAALILGVTDGIDNELQNAYAASGAMHVLAVSGLHVGIIYALLLFLLKPLQKRSWGRWWIAGISLLCLWCFAFVTGLSPSVLRAVAMFSFVAVARPFGARTNIYNTLAASAFVLLIYNPYLIMSVGFQLSYLAVLGIVYLQRPLYQLWETESKLLDWVWQITCVSIAAQLTTFSLGLLYFHQFPVYFLISNLFVIPLSTLILVLGIGLLAISPFTWLATWLGKLVAGLIWLLNEVVFITERLPLSIINNIHITTFQCWLLMAMLASLFFLLQFRKIEWLYVSALSCCFFTALQWKHFFDFVNQHTFTVYQINNRVAFEWIDAGQSYFFCDSVLANDEERIRFHIRPNRLLHQVSQVYTSIPFQRILAGGEIYVWRGKVFVHWTNKDNPTPLAADFQIISHNARAKPQAGVTILDGSNSIYLSKKIAAAHSSSFFSTAQTGAFTIKN